MPDLFSQKTTEQVLLGFDFGLRRIGVAVGQTITRSARPLKPLLATDGIPNWEQISALIKQWQPNALVVGIPIDMYDAEQQITHCARRFANRLRERYQLPVHGVDERLTTIDARERLANAENQKKAKKTSVDSMAAKLIVENWLSEN